MATVKTAVSLPKAVFDEAEAEAKELKVPRSRVFVIALEEYLQRRRKERLREQIDAAYAGPPDEEELAFMRRANALGAERLKREEEAAGVPPW